MSGSRSTDEQPARSARARTDRTGAEAVVSFPAGPPPEPSSDRASLFLREPWALEALVQQAIAPRIRTASAADPLRVWVPACAAGEELYTIAICLLDEFEAAGRGAHLQLFATDTDAEALRLTRAGVYAPSALQGLSAGQLARYFEPAGEDRVRVRERLREPLNIAQHDALHDPPIFSRLDLISGRNLPAHPAPAAARHFAASAHFALREHGWLLLAARADASALLERFAPLASGAPVYGKRTGHPVPQHAEAPLAGLSAGPEAANAELSALRTRLRSLGEERAVHELELQHTARALEASNADLGRLIDLLDVAALFLDPDERIRRFAGSAERLLAITADDLGRSLATLTSPLIDAALLRAVRHAVATDSSVQQDIPVQAHRWYLRRIQPHATTSPADGVLITWSDITPLKALQREVARIGALEQQRIGLELHDGIQQELTALGLFAQNLTEALDARGERQRAGRLTEGIAATNRHVQALARGLVPVPIDADSLAPALAELARSTGELTQIGCEFTLEGKIRMPNSDTATHLYRIAQEAVRNATRHARADRILIQLSAHEGGVRLEIRDNGVGLPPRAEFGRGVGLRLMEHRCALIGGTFAVQSESDGGTRVVCTLPGAEAPQ